MLRNIGFRSHKKETKSLGIIDKKISSNENIPLEEILSEESVIYELKNENKVLIKYLTKDKVKQMIDYIIKEPPEDAAFDRGHKLPWVCSQLFNIENSPILKYFYKTNKELYDEETDNENKMDIEEDDKNINKIELLEYLLTFLTSDKEPNYVLCGYFSSLIKTLLNTKPTIILNYFYKVNKNIIKILLNFSYRESIAEILNKIFQYDVTVEEFNVEEMDLVRMEMIEELFLKIDIDMDNEKLDSISTLIKNLSTEENLLTDLLNNSIIIHNLITNPLKDINLLITDESIEGKIMNKRRNFIIIIDTIINWINAINSLEIDLPSTTDESEEDLNSNNDNNNNFSHTLLSYELFNILLNLIKVNFNKNEENNKEIEILQSFDDKKINPLGLFRIKIVDLLGNLFYYFKNLPALYDQLLIESKFFENAIDYLFEYELNNVYQESLLFLFKKYLTYSECHPILSEFLFTKLNIMDIIISKIKLTEENDNTKKDCFLYSSGNTTKRGYISFLVSLAYKINTIIGGEPLRINDTLSREGSISFINRAAPFVTKEEITKFYGMEENELYEQISNESEGDKKNSKLNKAVKSMEKYLNNNWNEFFTEYIVEKIKLYETKLLKDDSRDSIFRNPFILDNDDEKVDNRQNNFGLGDDDEDEDVLGERMKKPDFNKILYGDDDIDFNMNNRFKMSMRLPKSNNKNIDLNTGRKRSSLGDKQIQSKFVVDEIDNFDFEEKKIKDKIEIEEEKDEKEEKEEEEENPLDKFKNKNKDDNEEDPFSSFKKNDKERKISLISFRKKKKDEIVENENFQDNNNDNNKEEEEEENALDKFNKETLKTTEEKMDIDMNDLYDDNDDNNNDKEDEDTPENKENNENKNVNNKNEEENNNINNDKNDDLNLYEDIDEDEQKDNPSDVIKNEKPNKDYVNDNDNDNNKEIKDDDNPLDKYLKINKIKNESNENPFEDIKKENKEEEQEEEENPIDKFNRENKDKILEKKKEETINLEEKKEDKNENKENFDDLLYENKEEDDNNEEDEEEEDDNNENNNEK